MSADACFDDAFADLKGGFDAVAAWNEGTVRDLISESSIRISQDPRRSAIELADDYGDLVDELEEQALSNPAATQALDEINAAMSKAMARSMSFA